MKRMILILPILALLLTACGGGEVYERAYTASGDGTNEIELSDTVKFQKNADLNVVVKLNSHDNDVEVEAIFYDPRGRQEGDAITATAGEGVGTVVLGLDWESRPVEDPDEEFWREGAWQVVIKVDGEEVDRLDFSVG